MKQATATMKRRDLLEAAAIGIEKMIADLSERLKPLREELGIEVSIKAPRLAFPASEPARGIELVHKRPRMSAKARARISKAQRKRWAAFHEEQAQQAKRKRA